MAALNLTVLLGNALGLQPVPLMAVPTTAGITTPQPPLFRLSAAYATTDFRAPFVVNLRVSAPVGYSVEWIFGDGQTAAGLQVEHTYYQAGTYTYKANFIDGHGKHVRTISKDVTIQSGGPERAEATVLLGLGRVWVSALSSVTYVPGLPRLRINDREIPPQLVSIPDGPYHVSVTVPGSSGPLEQTLSFTMAPLYGDVVFEEQLLELTNHARASGWNCETRQVGGPALSPLTRDPQLDVAATAQSAGMALAGYFSHASGLDGSTPLRRIRATGSTVRAVAENIAIQHTTPQEAIADWLKSKAHCNNIMGNFSLIGLSYVNRPDTDNKTYWTQVFGRP